MKRTIGESLCGAVARSSPGERSPPSCSAQVSAPYEQRVELQHVGPLIRREQHEARVEQRSLDVRKQLLGGADDRLRSRPRHGSCASARSTPAAAANHLERHSLRIDPQRDRPGVQRLGHEELVETNGRHLDDGRQASPIRSLVQRAHAAPRQVASAERSRRRRRTAAPRIGGRWPRRARLECPRV